MQTPKDPDHLAPLDPKPEHPGQWIRRHREGLGFTRHRLAERAGVALVTLKLIETRPLWPLDVEAARRLVAVILELAPEYTSTAPKL